MLAIRANDLGLVEIPLVRGRVDVELQALRRTFRSGGDVSERAHAHRVGREQQSRMRRYQGFVFACRSRTERSKKEGEKRMLLGREGERDRNGGGGCKGMHAVRQMGGEGVREGNARRRRSVSRMCVSTSLMPTPGPPLRERDGIMRRGRDAAAGAEAEGAGAEGPACEAAAGSVFEVLPLPLPPLPPPPPLADVEAAEAAAEVVVVAAVEFAGAAAAANDTLATAGSAVDADARLGMGPRRTRGTRWTLLYFFATWG